MTLVERISACGIVPVASVPDSDAAVRVCTALMNANLPVVEFTFRTAAAAESIAAAVRGFPEMIVGAGTVLSRDDIRAARDSGAAFAVAPGFNPVVVHAAQDVSLPFFPGVSTPSEVEAALQYGCTVQKFFPAESLGGAPYLNAMSVPYAHRQVRFIPTGGVNVANLRDYLALPSVLAVGGTWIASAEAIAHAQWTSISDRAREAVEAVRAVQDPRVQA